MDKNTPLFSISVADAERSADRELTDDELKRIGKALGYSTVWDALDEVVFSVAGGK